MTDLQRIVRRLAPWAFALFCVVVVALARRVVLPFVLALMLAYVLAPAVARLSRVSFGKRGRTMPRWLAVITCYIGIIGALGLFFGAFLPRLSSDIARLLRAAPPFFQRVNTDYAPRLSAWIEHNFPSSEDEAERTEGPRTERKLSVTQTAPGHWDISLEGMDLQLEPVGKGRWIVGPHRDDPTEGRLADITARLTRAGQAQAMEVLKLGQRFIVGLVAALAKIVLILMVAAFVLVDTDKVLGFVRGLLPGRHRGAWDELQVELDRGLAGVIRGQFLICLVNGTLTWIGLLIFKVKYALLLSLLAGAMSLVPVFGSILSSVPIVAVALVSGGAGVAVSRGLLMLGWIVGIHLVEANYLNPRIIGQSAKIHPLVVIFALVVGESVGGLVGALVAVPIASMVQTLFLFLRRRADYAPEAAAAAATATTAVPAKADGAAGASET